MSEVTEELVDEYALAKTGEMPEGLIYNGTTLLLESETVVRMYYTVETGQNSTGIGLSIVRSFIEKMDGTIGAEYKEGRLLIKVAFPIDDN